MRPTEVIEGCRASEAALLAHVLTLDEAVLRRPSLLPDWTVGHVLGHLIANADSVVRRLVGVAEDRVADQYPGGEAGRAAEIEELALLPYDEVVAGLRRSAAEIERAVDAVPDDGWDRLSRSVGGSLVAAHQVVGSRWREVEVHRADLGLGYRPAQWPPAMVDLWMPRVLEGLPARTDPVALFAWAMGRGPAPDLESWG